MTNSHAYGLTVSRVYAESCLYRIFIRIMAIRITVAFIFLLLQNIAATGFVEEVACTGSNMTIVVNKSDPEIIKWLRDASARPIVYVYGHKDRAPCGMTMKTHFDNSSTSATYNFTIPYGPACSVYLADLEPNFQTAETTVAIENNNAQYDNTRGLRVNHVFCLYTKQVETLRISDVSNVNEVIASVGGKPKPKVQMLFRDADGRPMKAAKFGDPVSLYLTLSPDNAYKAISPKHCLFSDREEMEEPDAKTLTFVQSNCPVTELSEVVRPVSELNGEIYYTHFQAFRFGERPTVYAHCKIEVCLDQNDCGKRNCYPKVVNSTILAEANRLRLRRAVSSGGSVTGNISDQNGKPGEEIALSNALTVLDHQQIVEVVGKASEMCLDQRVYQSLFSVIGFLSILLLLLLILIVHFIRKIRRYKKTAEAALNLPSIYYAHANVPPPSTLYSGVSNRAQSLYSPTNRFRNSVPNGLDFPTVRTEHGPSSSGPVGLPRTGPYIMHSFADDHVIPRIRN